MIKEKNLDDMSCIDKVSQPSAPLNPDRDIDCEADMVGLLLSNKGKPAAASTPAVPSAQWDQACVCVFLPSAFWGY
jgi:hypothetical protein